ncbi:his Kinase A domain protein [Collimonas fungivorans]|uniref:histidine kinase n=1 Tax=Collimonas fungivorans TaxID=158899 RepID=A0A127PGA7_9BURK|nr:ATP-binding protein [Collimonas fungivorans]AMO96850.1 his Kinase A domain protein [Collimonas fungivorans]
MSLRLRLLLLIGISLSLLWGAVSVWMLRSLDEEVHRTLDQRLAMSAQMVAGLMSQNPAAWDGRKGQPGASTLKMPPMAKSFDCQITSLRGEVIARTPGATLEAVAAVAPGYSERLIKGERWRSYTYEADGLRVTTADRLAERSSLLRNVTMAAVVPFVVAMIGSLIVLWFGVKNGLSPLERLRQALASRAPEVLTPIPEAAMSRDLLPLVNTLNKLLQRMNVTISRERRFTSDAAHELRTPLTAIKTHLQVARITQGKDAAVAMDYAEEGVARLQRTLGQLLTLSQIEGPFSWDDGNLADAEEVAQLAIRDASTNAPGRIVFNSGGKSAQLALPQALAVTALRNLLDNALRHTPAAQGVSLELQSSKDACVFRVRDHGPGLSAEELEMVTERFWRRGSGQGSGLGLSIVVAITERFGGAFELLQRPEGGLEATLRLPSVQSGPY